MILGEDPHSRDQRRPQSEVMNETTELFDHFQFMSRRSNVLPVDVANCRAFKSHLTRILRNGVPKKTVRDSINVFFSTVDSTKRNPWLWKVFVSNKIQDELLRATNVVPEVDSEILRWMINDFNRTEELPWDLDDDRRIRNIVLSHTAVLHRYPHFVVGLLEDFPLSEVRVVLSKVEDLIEQVILASRRTAPLVSELREMGVTLPPGITTKRTLRRCAPTLTHASLRNP